MLETAERFGAPEGWPGGRAIGPTELRDLLLSEEMPQAAEIMLDAGNCVPEEILGPDELATTWRH